MHDWAKSSSRNLAAWWNGRVLPLIDVDEDEDVDVPVELEFENAFPRK